MKVSRISCEICGCEYGLTEVYARACDKESPSATLCEKCKKKYFDYMLPGPVIFPRPTNIPSVTYIPFLSYAENLVYAYNVRYGSHDKTDKKEDATMQVTYDGFTGELVKLEKTFCRPQSYNLAIYDSEKQATISFTGVKLEDVKFLSGAVTFGG